MRTLAMSGRRGLSRTLLSTGTTTEAQVIRQLQHAGWQQVPRLLLPIEIDQGQGGGILKTTDRIQRRVNRCRFDEDNAMKFHAAVKAIPLGVAALTARLVALLPLPAWALERLYINGSILTSNDTVMPGGRLLNRGDLDEAFPDNPVRIDHVSMHGAVLNSLALKKYGISASTPTPAGGVIVRKPGSQEPWGLIMETAFIPVSQWGRYNNRFKIGGVKITIDASPQGRAAFFTTPYLTGGPAGEKNWRGEPTFPQDLVDKAVSKVYGLGRAPARPYQRRRRDRHVPEGLRVRSQRRRLAALVCEHHPQPVPAQGPDPQLREVRHPSTPISWWRRSISCSCSGRR